MMCTCHHAWLLPSRSGRGPCVFRSSLLVSWIGMLSRIVSFVHYETTNIFWILLNCVCVTLFRPSSPQYPTRVRARQWKYECERRMLMTIRKISYVCDITCIFVKQLKWKESRRVWRLRARRRQHARFGCVINPTRADPSWDRAVSNMRAWSGGCGAYV